MLPPHVIRAVAFDLDNTLWDVDPVIVRAEARWLEWLQENCPRIPERLSMDELRASRMALAAREPHNAHDFTYLRIASLAQHARECGYDESISEQAFEIFIAERNQVDLFADVRPGLRRLSTRYALASLSNGNADLGRIGVADLFSVSLNARGIGAAKPDPRCFERLVADLQLTPHEVIYVGDDPLLDVEAGRAAGLLTAWMNRTGQVWPATVRPADFNVGDCLELATQLGT
ncbi:MAG: hydrolase / 5-amino-6-(5-phospho-D-ribitylamino)uracil phosphatase [Gammaproteobacteria bacterium]|nr:hydrolase / 5-amino-6-(5-phospho-D-ribitylamino)uracil phosphatase [Gammaproteobacteria bacterium]